MTDPGAPAARPAIWRLIETLVRDMESRIQELNGHAAVHRTMREWVHEESALARANEVWKWLTRLRAGADDRAPADQSRALRDRLTVLVETWHAASQHEHWRSMAADTVNTFWFTNREAAMLLTQIDAMIEELRAAALDAAPSKEK